MAVLDRYGEKIITGASLPHNAYRQGGGVQQFMQYDKATGIDHIVKTQDCRPILEDIQRRRNAGKKANQTCFGYHLADIPTTTYERWIAESGLQPHQSKEIREMVIKKIQSGEHNELLITDDKIAPIRHRTAPTAEPKPKPKLAPAIQPKNFLANPLGG